jgi:lactate dehydrogenase-like 2-hydroxyacid dehydrogenase
MSFGKIIALGIDENRLDSKYWEQAKKLGKEFKNAATINELNAHDWQEMDCLLVPLNGMVDQTMIKQAPKLKYIGTLATGFDKIDIQTAKARGITVTNVPGYSTNAVAEFVFGAILEQLREFSRAKAEGKKGNYSDEPFEGTEVTGKTFGIIGLGAIGGKAAEIANGFGCQTIYWSRNRKNEYESKGIRYEELDKVIETSDFLSIHLLANAETEGIINAERIRKMKRGAFILNTCNTTLLDLETLIQRLQNRDIHYITMASRTKLEVVARLNALDHAVVYPPITYKTKEAHILRQEIFVHNLKAFLNGKAQNVVNP